MFPLTIGHDRSKCDGGTASCKTFDFPSSWKSKATDDPVKIASWDWSKHNGYGIDCGRSGIVVADQDPGDEWPFGGARVHRSGRGYHHIYEDLMGNLTNAQGLQPWGIDVRGDGGLIAGPGSFHPHAPGGVYSVVEDIDPGPAPADLVAAVQKRSKASDRVAEGKADGTPYADLSPDERAAVDDAVAVKIAHWRNLFTEAVDWSEGQHDYEFSIDGVGQRGGWELLTTRCAWSLACLAASAWSPLTAAEAEATYEEIVPEEIRGAEKCEGKFYSGIVAKASGEADLSFRALTLHDRVTVEDVFDVIEDDDRFVSKGCPVCGRPNRWGRHGCVDHADEVDADREAAANEPSEAVLDKVLAKYPVLDIAALLDPNRPARRWLLEDVFPEGDQASVVAPPGIGKSLLLAALAVAILQGDKEFLGRPITFGHDAKILYLDLENSDDDWAERLADLGVTQDEARSFIASGRFVPLSLPPLPGLDTKQGGKELKLILAAYGIRAGDLVVLDSTQRITDGEENSNDTLRNLYKHTSAELKRRGLTVIRTDNTGKDVGKGARGASSKRDDVGYEWLLEEVNEGTGQFTLRQSKRRGRGGKGGLSFAREVVDGRLTFVPGNQDYETPLDQAERALQELRVPPGTGQDRSWEAVRLAKEAASEDPWPSVTRNVLREAVANRNPATTFVPVDEDESL